MTKPELWIVPAEPVEMNSVIVERGPYRFIVGEHPEEVYLSLENARDGSCMFADPLTALRIAKAIIDAAGKALNHQFDQQLGKQ